MPDPEPPAAPRPDAPRPDAPRPDAPPPSSRRVPDEVDTERSPAIEFDDQGLLAAASGDAGVQASMHEIATAFRMNAEALHTLKQMQSELAQSLRRGDRSEMVLQSTRALNETFRNLSSVQRELLARLDRPQRAGRGPLIPMMLLGLLVVVVAGVYVILLEVQDAKQAEPAIDPVEIVRRERDSWKEGRKDGQLQSEREVQRLGEALEEAKERSRTLQRDLDSKVDAFNDIDRQRRAAELERDEFAGQVRKAQNEVMAKQALEDEIHLLRNEKKATDREVVDLEVSLERRRREVAYLRQRLADYNLDIPADDPPYVPPGEAPAPPAAGAAPEAEAEPRKPFLNLITAGRRKIAEQDAARASEPSPAARGAARGGDVEGPAAAPRRPGELPPPILRRRGGMERDAAEVQRVRGRINQLLDATARNGETWQLTRVDAVSQRGLGGVILLRYDAAGRLLDSIEARNLRITLDRGNQRVELEAHGGVRVARDRRVPLPPEGARVVVAEGEAARAWATSGLTMLRKK